MNTSRSLKQEFIKSKQAISVIILFHIIGLAGLSIISTRAIFLQIVPFHLLLMLLVIVTSHNPVSGRFLFFGLLVYVSAFCAEWIGIHRGWFFGDYHYGNTLGPNYRGCP